MSFLGGFLLGVVGGIILLLALISQEEDLARRDRGDDEW